MSDDAYFWEGARNGRLLLRTCASCDRVSHPPVPMCPRCHGLSWTTREASGRGTLFAWIVSRHPSDPTAPARVVALVDLEEGVRLVSNLRDADPAEAEIGMPLEVFFDQAGGNVLPQFRPAPRMAA